MADLNLTIDAGAAYNYATTPATIDWTTSAPVPQFTYTQGTVSIAYSSTPDLNLSIDDGPAHTYTQGSVEVTLGGDLFVTVDDGPSHTYTPGTVSLLLGGDLDITVDDGPAHNYTQGDVTVTYGEEFAGRFWAHLARFERKQARLKRKAQKKRLQRKKKAQEIADKLDRGLALIELKVVEQEAREAELARMAELVEANKPAIIAIGSERLTFVMDQALKKQTFSALERLERTLTQTREEEDFIMMAAQILVNQ